MSQVKFILPFLLFIAFFDYCVQKPQSVADKDEQPQKELIIYCENSVAPPINDLKKGFEKKYHCKVIIQNDCAQNLIGLINYSGKGDIFIPSSMFFFNMLRSKSNEEISDSVFLGYNELVFMVKKGNPKDFKGEPSHLISKDLSLIIANPETSSLGYETRKTLMQWKIYDKVLNNVVSLTTDSKGLIKSLKNDRADLVINFISTINMNGNKKYVDVIPFLPEHQVILEVYVGVLSSTSNKELAQSFISYVNTPESISVLNKYGFSKRKTLIF